MFFVGLVISAVPFIVPDASKESWCASFVIVAISKFFRSTFIGACYRLCRAVNIY